VYATVAATTGDDLTIRVGLFDLTSGAVTGTGAAVVATAGGLSFSVTYATTGIFVCVLTDAQTVTLGDGQHDLLFRLTPAGGDTQTYVAGKLVLTSSTTAGGSVGYHGGIVGNVMVVVY
jgi:hypothetical protein